MAIASALNEEPWVVCWCTGTARVMVLGRVTFLRVAGSRMTEIRDECECVPIRALCLHRV